MDREERNSVYVLVMETSREIDPEKIEDIYYSAETFNNTQWVPSVCVASRAGLVEDRRGAHRMCYENISASLRLSRQRPCV